jgi:hypothetical protein
MLWHYHNAKREPVGLIVRWDKPAGEKKILPVSRHKDGWRIAGMHEPRPLYRFPDLNGADRVYVVEGEKAADAAARIGLTATTSVHGAKSPHKTDWQPLAGKEVVILPDNDEAGRNYADNVATILGKLMPPARVKIVALDDLPDGGDIVDWVDAHGDAAEPDELRRQVQLLAEVAPEWKPSTQGDAPRPNEPGTKFTEQPHSGSRSSNDDDFLSVNNPWPEPPDEVALYGLTGEFVRLVEQHSEADPVALLAQFLVAYGNVIGRNAYFRAEADRHYLNLFACLVGQTSKGRKGVSWGQVCNLFHTLDSDWADNRIMSGLSSGEGLVWQVRDPIERQEPLKEKGRVTGYQQIEVDPGEADKRLLVVEPEFARTLRVLGRDGNTLSALIRQAWDTGNLRTLTKNSPAKATGAHTSILGHGTRNELLRYLTENEAGNGFGNRFLWFCVRRSKCLPEGGRIHQVNFVPFLSRLREAVDFARIGGELERDDEARAIWAAVYPQLSEGKPGLLGAMTARGEAQVMRLACAYALLDCSNMVRAEHLQAALALWEYSERSARYIFGHALGDPDADTLLRALRASPGGLTRTDIRNLFDRHKKGHEIGRALRVLLENGLARFETEETAGRPAECWFPMNGMATKAT